MKSIKLYKFSLFLSVAGILLFFGCSKSSSKIICGVCPEYASIAEIIPNIQFNVVDKITKQDLFFGSGAKYTASQIKFYHIINGKADSTSFVFFNDTTAHHFFLGVGPTHNTDTVTMKIADLPSDTFLFNTGSIGVCCPRLVLNSVLFNGVIVYTYANGPAVVTLTK